MRTVIGLFPSRQDVNQEIEQLEEAGFSRENIHVLANSRAIKDLIGCDPSCIVAKYVSWGALLGICVYGVFFIAAAWCDCNIYPISQTIAVEIALAGALFGTIIGGILGLFVGLAEYEGETHLYIQGINLGEKVIALDANQSEQEKAIKSLNQIGCLGVRMIPQPDNAI
jgi:sodium--glutamate symport carrier gltS